MDVLVHFIKPMKEARVDRKDLRPARELDKEYRSVAEYDPVLWSHCGLEKA